jgi:hypothetical protein
MSGWRKRNIAELVEAQALSGMEEHNQGEKMNREELEKLKNNGPCVCNSPDCEYCSMIGDFKFQWFVNKAELGIVRNQLEQAMEIAGALAARIKPVSEDIDDWCAVFDRLLAEVRGVVKPKEELDNASEI